MQPTIHASSTGDAASHADSPVFVYDTLHGTVNRVTAASCLEGITQSGVVALDGFVANRAALLGGLNPDTTDAGIVEALWRQTRLRAAEAICGDATWIAYDRDKREVTAVRDRMGFHSVFYAQHGDAVWLSLSLDALLRCWPGRRELNPTAIVRQINSQAPVAGETHYQGIHALERGCTLTVSNGGHRIQRYWHTRLLPELQLKSDDAYAEAYRAVLFQVAREYAPAGRAAITLSSGMDSTSVAAALREVAPALDLVAMTWTTPELAEADEVAYVREVAAKLDIPLHEIRGDQYWTLCHPEGLRTRSSSPFVLYYDDLWDAGHACIRDAGATTVFDGFSGDALFGANVFSYPDFLAEGRWLRLAREFHAHMRQPLSRISHLQAAKIMVLAPVARAWLPGLMAKRKPPAPVAWLHPSRTALWQSTLPSPSPPERKPGRRMRYETIADPFQVQVAGYIQHLAGRSGMQSRHVLLDHRLVEFALSLPTEQTIRNGQRKTVMRNAMRGRLPDSVVNMRGKIVPTLISQRGLREREQAKVWDYLTNMRAAALGYVDEAPLRSAYQSFIDGKTHDTRFFYALMLEDWLRRHF
jgi:asparagine synthase (glutamine-hydrolysing)